MHGWGPRLDWEHLQNWVPGALGIAAVILLVVVAANSPTQTNSKPAELPSSQSVVPAIKGQPGPIPAPSQPAAAQTSPVTNKASKTPAPPTPPPAATTGEVAKPAPMHDHAIAQAEAVAATPPVQGSSKPGLNLEVGIDQVHAERRFIQQRLELGRPSPQGFFACAKIPRRFASDARERQVRVDLRNEFAGGKRFGQIVIGAGVQPLDASFLAGPRGQHDDGQVSQVGILPDRLQQTEAVELGHHCVGDDEIGTVSPDRLDRRISVFRGLDVPMGAEQSSDVGTHVRIVVGDQDVALHLDTAHVGGGDVPLRDGESRRGVPGQPTQCFFDIRFGAPEG